MAYDVISIGDCTFDVNLTIHDASLSCQVNRENCQLCLAYGEKIPVDSVFRSLGGNAANNAVGLKRLGFTGGLYTVIGDDQIGERIGQYLDTEGMDKSLIQIEKGGESRYSTIISFRGEKTILDYVTKRTYPFFELPKTSWIYLSSVGQEYEDFFRNLAKYVKEKNIKLVFAPTQVQLSRELSTYCEVLAVSKMIFLNKQEAERMVGGREPKELLKKIADLGPKIVVITDGKDGSYAYDGNKSYQLGILNVPVVQATGAGDAYCGGFMAAIMKGLPVTKAMQWGTINAGSVMGKMGSQAGLLTLEQVLSIAK